jgi:hypothetical protein
VKVTGTTVKEGNWLVEVESGKTSFPMSYGSRRARKDEARQVNRWQVGRTFNTVQTNVDQEFLARYWWTLAKQKTRRLPTHPMKGTSDTKQQAQGNPVFQNL